MVDSTPLIPDGKEKKEGHRVLCCCDSRKAVIILNVLALALTITSLMMRLAMGDMRLMKRKSQRVGRYAPPAMQGPMSTVI